MQKEKLIRGLKIGIIIFLVLAISVIGVLQWKSDAIVTRVLATVQSQLNDTLAYSEVHMDVFSHFPCVAVQLHQLSLGNGQIHLIDHGDVDILIGLFPLLHDAIDIHQILVSKANINIVSDHGKWSYDVLKKGEEGKEGTSDKGWKTKVRALHFQDCKLYYADGEQTEFELFMKNGKADGNISPEILDIRLSVDGEMNRFKTDDYGLPEMMPIQLVGGYVFDFIKSVQEFKSWQLKNDALDVTLEGTITREDKFETYALSGTWADGIPDELKKWIPEDMKAGWKTYTFTGSTDGRFIVEGQSSKTQSPSLELSGKWNNGGFESSKPTQEIKNIDVDFTYRSQDPEQHQKSSLRAMVSKKSTFGKDMKGDIFIADFDHPILDIDLEGNVPLSMLNLFSSPSLEIESGDLDVEVFSLHDFKSSNPFLPQLLERGKIKVASGAIQCTYYNNPVSWTNGKIEHTPSSGTHFSFDEMNWNKATAKELTGDLHQLDHQIGFNFKGDFCDGNVDTKGTISTSDQRQVIQSDWIVKDIEMRKLLEAFSNFDQTFITSENLSGKANAWVETIIPLDANWEIKPKEVEVNSALEIHDGRLKNLKTLEDFSDYVHVEDLRDIHFNEWRNYLRIEDGKVILPVSFIQSSAMNMSISGVHSFDQKILYNMKLNAGQTISNKLKKTDFRKDLKSARKSGWLNLYFVLEGTTSNVRYQQYRTAVISAFEQSTQLKENLRNGLVKRFGYEVYWLEPNEWEDIPEYK